MATPREKIEKKRILIVDDHAVLREALAAMINHEPDLAVCGQAASVAEALAALRAAAPDLMLVDLTLEGSDGLELLRAARRDYPALIQLVLSGHDEAEYAEAALQAGAHGYVRKAQPGKVLLGAIRAALAPAGGPGEAAEPPAAPGEPTRREGAKRPRLEERLSQRELLVFDKLGSGLSSQDVARELKLSPNTIQRYRENIKRKLGLAGAAELQRAAFEYHYAKKHG